MRNYINSVWGAMCKMWPRLERESQRTQIYTVRMRIMNNRIAAHAWNNDHHVDWEADCKNSITDIRRYPHTEGGEHLKSLDSASIPYVLQSSTNQTISLNFHVLSLYSQWLILYFNYSILHFPITHFEYLCLIFHSYIQFYTTEEDLCFEMYGV